MLQYREKNHCQNTNKVLKVLLFQIKWAIHLVSAFGKSKLAFKNLLDIRNWNFQACNFYSIILTLYHGKQTTQAKKKTVDNIFFLFSRKRLIKCVAVVKTFVERLRRETLAKLNKRRKHFEREKKKKKLDKKLSFIIRREKEAANNHVAFFRE